MLKVLKRKEINQFPSAKPLSEAHIRALIMGVFDPILTGIDARTKKVFINIDLKQTKFPKDFPTVMVAEDYGDGKYLVYVKQMSLYGWLKKHKHISFTLLDASQGVRATYLRGMKFNAEAFIEGLTRTDD